MVAPMADLMVLMTDVEWVDETAVMLVGMMADQMVYMMAEMLDE